MQDTAKFLGIKSAFFLLRFLNLSEIFLLSYFLLSIVSSKRIILFLPPIIFLTAAFLTDIFWGSPGSNPAEQTSVVSILLISLIIIAMRFPWKKTKNNKAYYSFITAITINVVNSLIGVSFIEVLTEVTVVLVSLLNLIAYSFYTIGFYRLIKN